MQKIFLISGPCGCGKTTLTDAYARHLVQRDHKTVYVIHGDVFHQGFVEPEDKPEFFVDGKPSDQVLWETILKFTWDAIIATADRALRENLDVFIDYVVEDELPRVKALSEKHRAALYYIVLTADKAELESRIRSRGDAGMMERALFLKRKLESRPDNQGHLYDTTGKSPAEAVREIVPERFSV